MRSITSRGQLTLLTGVEALPAPAAVHGPRARPRLTRAERKAARLDELAVAAERELAECWRTGDATAAQAAHERARGARRAAQILRAGPAGVAEMLGGRHEAA